MNNAQCNAARGFDSNKPFTCVSGYNRGNKCSQATASTDCPTSENFVSCQADSSSSKEKQFLDDLGVQVFDESQSYGQCYDRNTQAIQTVNNAPVTCYVGVGTEASACDAGYYCKLYRSNPTGAYSQQQGYVNDWDANDVRPTGRVCAQGRLHCH